MSGSGSTVEHNRFSADIERGVILDGATGNTVQRNTFAGVRRQGDYKHAIEVTRSNHHVRFLHPKGWSYFDTLREKLHWNEGVAST